MKNLIVLLGCFLANPLFSIDIRENGGGNSALAELMIPYFSNKPYRLTAGMKWKVSEPYKQYIKGSQGGKEEPAFYFTMQNGSVYFYDNKNLKKPLENLNKIIFNLFFFLFFCRHFESR